MLAYVELMRPLNCLMTAIGVLVGSIIIVALGFLGLAHVYLAMLAAFLIAGAGNAVNDYYDVEADRINRPRRPIPSGRASRRSVLYFSIALFVIGILLAGLINFLAFAIAVINSIILFAYSHSLKDSGFAGNVGISYLVGSSFLFGGAAVGNVVVPGLLFLLAGFSNLTREIVKTLEDVEGDRLAFLKKLKAKTKNKLAAKFGLKGGRVEFKYNRSGYAAVGVLSMLAAIIISPLPYTLGLLNWTYLVVLVPTDIVFLAVIIKLLRRQASRGYHKISKMIKLGMFLGLISFLMGALI